MKIRSPRRSGKSFGSQGPHAELEQQPAVGTRRRCEARHHRRVASRLAGERVLALDQARERVEEEAARRERRHQAEQQVGAPHVQQLVAERHRQLLVWEPFANAARQQHDRPAHSDHLRHRRVERDAQLGGGDVEAATQVVEGGEQRRVADRLGRAHHSSRSQQVCDGAGERDRDAGEPEGR